MCPDGFLLGSDWATCEDVDECENDKMGCDQLCINTPGSYQVNKQIVVLLKYIIYHAHTGIQGGQKNRD